MDSKTTRLPADLLDAAEAAGRAEHRSTTRQIEHWARFGMFFDAQTSSTRRRIQRAVAGEEPLDALDEDERATANSLINAAISTAANGTSFAQRLAEAGVTTVVLDDDANLVRRHPDGSTSTL